MFVLQMQQQLDAKEVYILHYFETSNDLHCHFFTHFQSLILVLFKGHL